MFLFQLLFCSCSFAVVAFPVAVIAVAVIAVAVAVAAAIQTATTLQFLDIKGSVFYMYLLHVQCQM